MKTATFRNWYRSRRDLQLVPPFYSYRQNILDHILKSLRPRFRLSFSLFQPQHLQKVDLKTRSDPWYKIFYTGPLTFEVSKEVNLNRTEVDPLAIFTFEPNCIRSWL